MKWWIDFNKSSSVAEKDFSTTTRKCVTFKAPFPILELLNYSTKFWNTPLKVFLLVRQYFGVQLLRCSYKVMLFMVVICVKLLGGYWSFKVKILLEEILQLTLVYAHYVLCHWLFYFAEIIKLLWCKNSLTFSTVCHPL